MSATGFAKTCRVEPYGPYYGKTYAEVCASFHKIHKNGYKNKEELYKLMRYVSGV